MAGVSCHFDHLTGKTVMGQQVLTLGYASEEVFLPLDNQLYISQKNIQPRILSWMVFRVRYYFFLARRNEA